MRARRDAPAQPFSFLDHAGMGGGRAGGFDDHKLYLRKAQIPSGTTGAF
jgi:hypothetical protein